VAKTTTFHDHHKKPAVPTSPLVKKFATPTTFEPSPVIRVAVKSQAEARAAKAAPRNSAPAPEKAVPPKISAAETSEPDVAPRPIVSKTVEAKLTRLPKAAKPTNSEIKQALINEQLAAPITPQKPVRTRRRLRAPTVVSIALALVVMGGYLAYANMPSLSVRVAASRAGVDARYPGYKPTGYRLEGPVAFSPGQVVINYQSNGNDWHYSLSQQNSNWDSTAVLENRVLPESKDYETFSQKGLTVYRYGKKAIWVNGGVLYTIDGDAELSNEQLLKIVDSL
jgi:hypothetical protein